MRSRLVVAGVVATSAGVAATAAWAQGSGAGDQIGFDSHEVAGITLAASVLAFSLAATALLMRSRIRGTHQAEKLRSELLASQVENDRLRALLFVEPQVLISWSAGDLHPDISGDTSLMMSQHPQQHQPQRILAFGTWLPANAALQMDHAVDALLDSGEGFTLSLITNGGRAIEAMGRAIGGKAIVRIREISGIRQDLAELTAQHQELQEQTRTLLGFAMIAPWPIWARRDGQNLSFANNAYVRATEALDPDDAIARGLELLDSDGRSAMARSLSDGRPFSGRMPINVGGERRTFDVHALNVNGGNAGMAIDASEACALSAALVRMAELHRRTLDQLSSGVAVFDGQRRLAFYNDSYRRLWDLDVIFLDSNPEDSSVLDRLRAGRKLPEQADFRSWKAKLHEAYHALEPAKDIWYLPDGRALSIVTTPNPEGGVTYLFDDVTESLELARRYDGLIRVQRETLDNLTEAVAVFGSNGRAQLFNPAFTAMWNLTDEALQQRPHVETVEAWCRPLLDNDDAWKTLRGAVTSFENRCVTPFKVQRTDGVVLNCMTMQLPDGATMVTFQDISDTENMERALRERNEALEAADKMKVDFVHHVSYELRSPLTTVIGFAHFLNDPSTGPLTPKQSEYVGYITTSTNVLLAMIDNILDLATINAGAMTLNLDSIDINRAIAAAAEGIQDRLVRDNIKLAIDATPDIGKFIGDESRVIQVLYNLLANAVGFSPKDDTIKLTARRTHNRVVFSVSDHGRGFSPDYQDKAFNWFESDTQGSRHRGAGLGLSLVRSFIDLHHGSIHINSDAGKGTTVTCEFPLDQPKQHSDAAE